MGFDQSPVIRQIIKQERKEIWHNYFRYFEERVEPLKDKWSYIVKKYREKHIEGFSEEEVRKDKEDVQRAKERVERRLTESDRSNKEAALIWESILAFEGQFFKWFGERSKFIPTLEYDDWFNHVDLVGDFFGESKPTIAIDATITSNFEDLKKKITQLLRDSEKGSSGKEEYHFKLPLRKVKYYVSEDEKEIGPQGSLLGLILTVDRFTLEELVDEILAFKRTLVAFTKDSQSIIRQLNKNALKLIEKHFGWVFRRNQKVDNERLFLIALKGGLSEESFFSVLDEYLSKSRKEGIRISSELTYELRNSTFKIRLLRNHWVKLQLLEELLLENKFFSDFIEEKKFEGKRAEEIKKLLSRNKEYLEILYKKEKDRLSQNINEETLKQIRDKIERDDELKKVYSLNKTVFSDSYHSRIQCLDSLEKFLSCRDSLFLDLIKVMTSLYNDKSWFSNSEKLNSFIKYYEDLTGRNFPFAHEEKLRNLAEEENLEEKEIFEGKSRKVIVRKKKREGSER